MFVLSCDTSVLLCLGRDSSSEFMGGYCVFKTLLFWVLVKNCCTMCECIVLLFLWLLGSSSVLLSVVRGGMYVFECVWKIVVFIRRGGEGGFVRWWSGWFG